MNRQRPRVRYLREVWMRVKDRQALAEARVDAGFTQYELAYLCRCTQATISALERGAMTRCSQDLADAIASRLGRRTRELFELNDGSRVHRMANGSTAVDQARVVAAPSAKRRGPRSLKDAS
jgi:DNA-binding XRE family transcriptional regulator